MSADIFMASEVRGRERKTTFLAALLTLVLTLAVFHQVWHEDFVNWDDPVNVYQNPYFHPVTPAHLLRFWQASYEGLYIPVSYMAYACLASIAHRPIPMPDPSGGMTVLNPHVFHAANLVLHLCNVLLVFVILRLLVKKDWAACGGALLFAIHPLQVEAVAWISELRGLLGAFFALLALWQYLLFALIQPESQTLRRRRAYYGLALLAFLLGLLAKPSVVVMPLIAWLLDWGLVRRPLRQTATALLGWLCVVLPVIIWTRGAQPVPPSLDIPLWQRFFVAGDALAFYGIKLTLPWRLATVYARTPHFLLHQSWGYWTWLIPASGITWLWLCRKRLYPLVIAGAIFLAGVLPVLGFVPFLYQRISTVADRYVYLALLGPALGVAWLLSQTKAKTAPLFYGVVLTAWAGISLIQVGYWNDSEALFEHTLAIAPQSPSIHDDLGQTLAARGRTQEAIHQHLAALDADPANALAHYDLALVFQHQGKVQEAVARYNAALQCRPDYPEAHCNLGEILDAQGDTAEAQQHLMQALQLDPNLAEAHNSLALVLAEQGKTREAISEWQKTAALWPDNAAVHYNLAVALNKSGNRLAARAQLRVAAQIKLRNL